MPKWDASVDWLVENPGAKAIPKRTKDNKHLAMYVAKYTSQDNGQQKLGGWNNDGIRFYNTCYLQIRGAKFDNYGTPEQAIKESWTQLEKDFLAKLRAELGITASTR